MSIYEPWKKHDGHAQPRRNGPMQVHIIGDGKRPSEGETCGNIPNWHWRMKRVRTGLLRWETRPVCDDPAYAPIVAYRFMKPPRASVETVEELLHEITHPAPVGSPAGAQPVSSLLAPGRCDSAPSGLFGRAR